MIGKLLRRLGDRWHSWHLDRDVAAGRVKRGRQLGDVEAQAEPVPTIEMRVYRAATDTWENV